ncbi:likely protein kinase [Pseudozyma hubeiensis SY62]|uniref:Likely protein kinase n=1 Tax=Pseudozyma hubeiensis (strain SY62) TaxID=1305764 RepID=R9P5E8_PSEHS|nr:likely protein kinase [Pseudozyma hubeiensis SY62]GAC96544.1 likely protein kinase [Pseudozyma hubeiensis SY62]
MAAAATPSTSSATSANITTDTSDTIKHQSVHAQLEALQSAPLDGATPDGASSDSSASATSPAYKPLSLAMAGHVLGALGPESASGSPAPLLDAGAPLSPPQLYSSPALPADSKDLAHPVLIAPSHDANRNKPSPASTSPGHLSTQDPSSSSASVSPSVVSGSSTPARSAMSELHIYAQQIQQQLLNQHMHQQLAAGRLNLPSGSSPPRAAPTSQVASASASTYNSPSDSGRTSPNLFGSTRSQRTPHVLETNRLDIQTHTSGRRMVNQYLIEGELGRGVHGKVRLARDLETGERVAVKIVEREARKRLGAGLGLLNRNHRTKDQSRLSAVDLDAPTLSGLPSNSDAQDADRGTDSPQEDVSGSASTTVKGVPTTPSTQFAPLPHIPKSPSASAFGLSRRQPSDRDVERRREKEREKARKALLWTTDQKVRREIAIMKKCSHDNVVQLKEVIDDPQSKKIFMVLEHMEGGEVVWKDDQGHPALTVDEARQVLRDVVCGLEYLHYQGIIHRDIKPANLLWDKDHRVKISDFGVSHFSYAMMIANDHAASASASASSASDPSLADDRELAKTAGSPAFFAPELCMSSFSSASPSVDPFQSATATSLADTANAKVATPPARPKVTKAIDVWALGITLYCLLFGNTAFTAESEYALFAVIPSTDYSIPTFMGADRVRVGPRKPRWQSRSQWTDEEADAQPASPSELCPDADLASLSDDAKQLRDLLDRLLEKDPAKRITLEDVKKHPWVTRGLQDAPAWLSETDPQHMPFVEISHADVEDALTGFSKLKQRVKRWQSKLLDSFAGGRRRSKSINNSSAASSVHADMRTDSGTSSPQPGRAVGTEKADSMPVTPFDSSSQSAPSTSSVRTPRTPLKGHIFFTRQKSAGSVGRRDGVSALRALTAAHRDESDSIASDSPKIKDTHTPVQPIAHQTVSPPQTSPQAFGGCETEAPEQATNLSPMLPPPVLVDGADNGAMGPPTLASHRRASAQSTSSSGLRPDLGPEIPQRTSSDTHGAARRVSATSASPSLHTSSPRMSSLHRASSRQDSTGNDSQPQRAASPRRSIDSEGRSSTLSISQASRVSGRHRLGDFLRGNWLMNGADDRNRSTSRPSTRGSRDAPPFSSTLGGASLSKRSGSIGSTASSVRPALASSVPPVGPLSVDTLGAVQQAGARPESGTPTSAPVLGSTSSGGFAGAPSLSTEVLADPSESASLARSAFSALSQPSSPLTGSDAVGPFAFDHFGRRRHFDTPLEVAEYENDDVDLELELELSDDDLSDDLHGAHSANRGPMLINSGNGWTVRDGDEQNQHIGQSAFLPEAHARKESSGSVSSNDILTPSVEGGYNVFKPPYQHILSPSGSSGMPDHRVAADASIPADEIAAPDCQTFAMGASLSSEADALRKANLTELGIAQAAVSDPLGSTRLEAEPTPTSSASVSRSASHLQHGSNESSRAPSAAETQATRSDVGGVQPEGKDLKAKDGTAATEESQFADAEEEGAAQDGLDSISAKHALLSGSGATLGFEEEDDSDDQAVSFQARRKRSTRFRTPHPANGQA